jgi:hypothetical protein
MTFNPIPGMTFAATELTEPVSAGAFLTTSDTVPFFNGTEAILHPLQPVLQVTEDGDRTYKEALLSIRAILPQQSGTLVRNWVARFPVHPDATAIEPGELVVFDPDTDDVENPIGGVRLVTGAGVNATHLGRAILGYNDHVPVNDAGAPKAAILNQKWIDVEYCVLITD